MEFEGNVGLILHNKLKNLKKQVMGWVHDNLQKVERRIEEHELALLSFDTEEEERVLSEEEAAHRHKLRVKLQENLRLEDYLWSKKAKSAWRRRGDKNTKFFHKIVESRASSNSISHLFIEGRKVTDLSKVQKHVEDFFTLLYTEEITDRPDFGNLNLKVITQDQSDAIEKPFTESEILNALKDLAGEKTPVPDGFPIRFIYLVGTL